MELFKIFGTIALKGKDQFNQDLDNSSEKASKFAGKLKNGLATAAKIGAKAVAGVSAAVTVLGGYLTKVGGDFDAAMSEVQAISGATGDELNSLREKAKEMGAETKFSATESAEAFKYMAMAGWKTGDMLDGISGIMNLAAASGENLGEVSDIVTDALTAFGLQASESAHFADVLAAASSNSNTNVSMLGASFKYVAPVAGALGYSIEDVAAALGTMANSGIKAEQAGTSMRAILARLAKPTKEVDDAFSALGISATEAMTNADGSVKPLAETLGILREKMSGLSEAEKASAATGIAGQEAMSGLLAIVNASDADFDKLTAAIANSDGTAQKMAETMQDNLPGAITKLKSAVEGFGITFFDTFSGKAQEAVETLTGYVSRLTEAFNSGGLDGLLSEFDVVLTEALEKIIEVLPKIIEVGGEIIVSLANGIVRNLPALADAALEIVFQLSDSIIDGIPNLISTIIEVVEKIVGKLYSVDTLTKINDTGLKLVTALSEGLISAIPELLHQVPILIANYVSALIVQFPKIIATGIEIIFALIDGIIQAIPELNAAIPEVIIGIVNGLINNLDKIILAAIQIIVALIKGIIGAIPELIAIVPRVIMAIVDTIKNYDWAHIGSNIVQGLKDGIANAWESLKNWFKRKWDGLFGGLSANVSVNGSAKGAVAGVNGSHASGLDYVPFDGYIAELHKGEMVVPKREAQTLRNSEETEYLLRQILDCLKSSQTISINSREFGRLVRGVT